MIKAEEINTFFKNSKEICINFKHCDGCPMLDSSGCCRTVHLTQKQVDLIMEWKPPVDWSKVPIDTRVIVWNDSTRKHKRYFTKYANGKIYAFVDGATSWSGKPSLVYEWKYGELAEGV